MVVIVLAIICIIIIFIIAFPLIFIAVTAFYKKPKISHITGGRKSDGHILTPKELMEFNRSMVNYAPMKQLIQTAKTCVEYKDIEERVPYGTSSIPALKVMRRAVHNGQFKLLITEIQFLTQLLNYKNDKAYVVYAGSAPSHKLGILQSMFPNVIFILVDPREHYIKYVSCEHIIETQYSPNNIDRHLYFKIAAGNEFNLSNRRINVYNPEKPNQENIVSRDASYKTAPLDDNLASIIISRSDISVFIIEDFLTEELCKSLSKLGDNSPLYFISDIRTSDDTAEAPSNIDIIWNSAQQINWIRELKPKFYMLKFHPPYPSSSKEIKQGLLELEQKPMAIRDIQKCIDLVDFMSDYENGQFNYLAHDHLYIQAFAPLNSTEVRLIGHSLEITSYDLTEFEEKMRYYNVFHRPFGNHSVNHYYEDREVGIDRCGDCAITCKIINDYVFKYFRLSSPDSVLNLIQEALNSFDRTLTTELNTHGQSDIHKHAQPNSVMIKGINVDFIVEKLSIKYIQNNIPHIESWQKHNALSDALKWAELRHLISDVMLMPHLETILNSKIRPYFKDHPSNVGRTIFNSVLMKYLFGDICGDYYIYDRCSKFFNDHDMISKIVAEIMAKINNYKYVPDVTKGFALLDNGFTINSSNVIMPDIAKEMYTPEQFAIDVLFTEGIPTLRRNIWGKYRNCEVDYKIIQLLNNIRLTENGSVDMIEIATSVRASYYGWRKASSLHELEIDKYSTRTIWGGKEVLDCNEVFGQKTLILIHLHSIPAAAHFLIHKAVRRANPKNYIVILTKYADLSYDGNLHIADKCTNLLECTSTQCKEKLCDASFMRIIEPTDSKVKQRKRKLKVN
jgi:hypothetical protein